MTWRLYPPRYGAMSTNTTSIEAYTDGSCLKNPGKGGWAYLYNIEAQKTSTTYYNYGAKANTTNNEMELTAFLKLLKDLLNFKGTRKFHVIIHCDSQYVLKSFVKLNTRGVGHIRKEKDIDGWYVTGKPKKNLKILKQIYNLLVKYILSGNELTLKWVKGHAGDEFNEIVDKLARRAAEGPTSKIVLKKYP